MTIKVVITLFSVNHQVTSTDDSISYTNNKSQALNGQCKLQACAGTAANTSGKSCLAADTLEFIRRNTDTQYDHKF